MNTKESQILALIVFILQNLNNEGVEDVLTEIEGYQLDLTEKQNIQYYIDMLKSQKISVNDIDEISNKNAEEMDFLKQRLVNAIMCP